MYLIFGTPKIINFPFGTNVKLSILGSPILNPFALRKAKIVCNFGLSECNRVKHTTIAYFII